MYIIHVRVCVSVVVITQHATDDVYRLRGRSGTVQYEQTHAVADRATRVPAGFRSFGKLASEKLLTVSRGRPCRSRPSRYVRMPPSRTRYYVPPSPFTTTVYYADEIKSRPLGDVSDLIAIRVFRAATATPTSPQPRRGGVPIRPRRQCFTTNTREGRASTEPC